MQSFVNFIFIYFTVFTLFKFIALALADFPVKKEITQSTIALGFVEYAVIAIWAFQYYK